MSMIFILKQKCSSCESTADLYGSNCKHMTLCLACAKYMADKACVFLRGDENEEADEEGGGLIKSGKELTKLQLGRAGGLNNDAGDGDMDVDMDPTPRQKVSPEEEAAENSPLKLVSSGFTEGTPSTSKSAKGKRNMDVDDAKPSKPGLIAKKQEPKCSVKEQSRASSKGCVPSKSTSKCCSNAGAITEEELREFLVQTQPVTTQALVGKFKARLQTAEDKHAFASILRRICKIEKSTGSRYNVLRESSSKCSNAGAVTEEEIRAILLRKQRMTTAALVGKFKARLKTAQEKHDFAGILRRIGKIHKSTGGNYLSLRERDTQLELSILCSETREMKI